MRLIEGAGGFADFWSGSPLGELAAKQTEGGGMLKIWFPRRNVTLVPFVPFSMLTIDCPLHRLWRSFPRWGTQRIFR